MAPSFIFHLYCSFLLPSSCTNSSGVKRPIKGFLQGCQRTIRSGESTVRALPTRSSLEDRKKAIFRRLESVAGTLGAFAIHLWHEKMINKPRRCSCRATERDCVISPATAIGNGIVYWVGYKLTNSLTSAPHPMMERQIECSSASSLLSSSLSLPTSSRLNSRIAFFPLPFHPRSWYSRASQQP